jgi:DNA helicase-2/ATP-dependent DNA helicase PcrA
MARLWKQADFKPNDSQREAILHTEGPLFLPAGPGSGKTRVLLWHAINLIANHYVAPQDIYLSTFTEKAALQLRDGLRAMLGAVTAVTNKPYDISKMYVGTVHSLCQRLLRDRRSKPAAFAPRPRSLRMSSPSTC